MAKRKRKGILGLFGILPNRKKKTVVPAKKTKKNDDNIVLTPINLPSELKKAMDYFQSDWTMISSENTPNNKLARYQDLEFMVYNEGLMFSAAQIYASETSNSDEQNRIIGIKAGTRGRENKFYQWMKEVGYSNNVLKSIAWDLTVFGDAFNINDIDLDEKGITEVVPISPKMVKDRLEFQAAKIMEAMAGDNSKSYQNLQARSKTLQQLANKLANLDGSDSYADAYKSYLFGYLIGDSALPPWQVTHFRRFSSGSEFAPFGRPLFMGSIARYKSYKATELIVDSARMASFPTKVFEIQGSEDMGSAELQHRMNQVRQMYANVTSESKDKDELSVGEAIFTVEGLVKYNQFESRIDLNQIGDLENKRKDLILSTNIPEGYLFPERGGFGTSGQSLLQQSKMVARRVYDSQTAILEAITEQYRLHLYITEGEDAYNEDFELYMNYPVVEETSDRMRLKSDSVRLATDIISNIGQSLGLDRGEALPVDIVRDVFSKYSFLDMEEVSDWLDIYTSSKDVIEEELKTYKTSIRETEEDKQYVSPLKVYMEELVLAKNFFNSLKDFVSLEPNNKIREKVVDRLTEEIVRRHYFKSKKNLGIQESVINGKHSYSSFANPSNSLKIALKEVDLHKNGSKLREEE